MPRVTEGMFAEGAHTVDPREPLLSESRGAKNELDDLFAGMSGPTQTQQQPTIQQNFGQPNITVDNKEDWSEVWETQKRKQLDESRVVWAQQLWEEQKNDFENMYQAHQDIVTPKITAEIAEDKTKWEEAKEKGQEIVAKAQEAGSSAVETVQQKGREFKEATAEKLEAAKEKTQELTEKAQEKGVELKEKVQEKAADVKESVKEGLETAKEKAIEAKDFTKEKLCCASTKVEEWKDTAFEKGAEAKENTANVMSNIATHVKDAALTVGHAVADTFSHVVEKLKPHDKEKDDQFNENNKAVVENVVVEETEDPIAAPEDPTFSAVKLNTPEEANLEFAEEPELQGRVVAEAPIMQPRDKTKSRFC